MIKKNPEATTGCECLVALLAFIIGGLLFGEFAVLFAGFMRFLSWLGIHAPLFR